MLQYLCWAEKLRAKQRSAQATYSDMTEFGQELFQGMDVIRAFNKESIIGGLFNRINKKIIPII